MPFIVFSANYLVIPYPRWIVLLIETAPALAAKLALPHLLPRVPHGIRPLLFACCWVMMAVATDMTPPNVVPPMRVFTSCLASVVAAATEMSLLGMMPVHGQAGLAGWGAGTGAGGLACAVLPFALTVWMGKFLRSSIVCIYALAATVLFAYFAIMPQRQHTGRQIQDESDLESDIEGSTKLLNETPQQQQHVPARPLTFEEATNHACSLVRPYMLPLFLAFAAGFFIFPGISRALPVLPGFQTFFGFATSYGSIFQMGNLVSRSMMLLLRPRSATAPLVSLGLVAVIAVLSATAFPPNSFVLLGATAFYAGLMGGAAYMSVFAMALDKETSDVRTAEFDMQAIGAGETAGTICGSLVAEGVLGMLCSTKLHNSQRWCQVSR